MSTRTTIAKPVSVRGIGLHSGREVRLTLRPGEPGAGLVFCRRDLGGREVRACWSHLARTDHATTLEADGAVVGTVEHLLSAAAGLGIDDLRADLDGPEVPILDGSAVPFVSLLRRAGRRRSDTPRQILRIERAVTVRDGDRHLTVRPGQGFRIRYGIAFDHPVIGESERTFSWRPRDYAREIAPARTFCRLDEVEALRRAGLARGGSLQNALVVDDEEVLNGPLRFPDEFVRHKILDLIGDFALLGLPVQGRVVARRAGHALHTRMVETLMARTDAWSLVPDGLALPAAAPAVAATA